MGRFFLNPDGFPGFIEFDDAIALGIGNRVAENAGAAGKRCTDTLQSQAAIKKIVTQDQADGIVVDKLFADQKRLGDALGFRLYGIVNRNAPALSIAQQLLKSGDILGCRNNQDIIDAGNHQGGQGIVNHRFVIDRLQLFTGHQGQGVEPGAGAAGEDNSFSYRCHYSSLFSYIF